MDSNAYNEGYTAYREDWGLHQNPHPYVNGGAPYNNQHMDWATGWLMARQDDTTFDEKTGLCES